MHARFHKDFNIYQYQVISIYRDIFYPYIDTLNVESMTALTTCTGAAVDLGCFFF